MTHLAHLSYVNPNTSDTSVFEQRVRDAKLWHLLVYEDTNRPELNMGDRIYGQFTPQDLSHNLGANIAESGGFSRTHPLVQWVGGNAETLTFQARLFSEHANDSTAADKFKVLQLLCQSLQPMNRPPITVFFWGNAFPGGVPCLVESLGGVKYDEIRSDGSIRGLTLSITLKKTVPFLVTRVVESSMERTPLHTVREGETYEMIAKRKYGDPMLGVILRRENPRFPMEKWAPRGLSNLSTNEQIKLYDRSDITKNRIKPQSHIFDPDDQIASDNRRYFFEKRGYKTALLPRK